MEAPKEEKPAAVKAEEPEKEAPKKALTVAGKTALTKVDTIKKEIAPAAAVAPVKPAAKAPAKSAKEPEKTEKTPSGK